MNNSSKSCSRRGSKTTSLKKPPLTTPTVVTVASKACLPAHQDLKLSLGLAGRFCHRPWGLQESHCFLQHHVFRKATAFGTPCSSRRVPVPCFCSRVGNIRCRKELGSAKHPGSPYGSQPPARAPQLKQNLNESHSTYKTLLNLKSPCSASAPPNSGYFCEFRCTKAEGGRSEVRPANVPKRARPGFGQAG